MNTGTVSSNPAKCMAAQDCIQKFSDSVDKVVCPYNNKHSLRSNVKGYGGETN
jgi:hypothetical protein